MSNPCLPSSPQPPCSPRAPVCLADSISRTPMAYKAKGIFKGLKTISRIFAAKVHEIEIGHPTDVKHVAHIGWGDTAAAGNASPSWANDIMASSNLLSLENFAASAATGIPWVSEGFDRQPRGTHQPSGAENSGGQGSATCADDVPMPTRRKKPKPKDGLPTAPSRPSTTSMDEAAPPPLSAAAAAANDTR